MENNGTITIFKCPFFDECFYPITAKYYDDKPVKRCESVKCKAPFLDHEGGQLCALTIEKDKIDKYPNNIKGVTLHNSMSGRIKRLFYR